MRGDMSQMTASDSKSVYLKVNLLTILGEKHNDFVELCRAHQVEKMHAFGSSITNHFDFQKSDIDLVVKINIEDPVDRGEALLSLWDKLESLFERKVDLLTDDSIHNPYLKANIERTKKLIYDREREKVFI